MALTSFLMQEFVDTACIFGTKVIVYNSIFELIWLGLEQNTRDVSLVSSLRLYFNYADLSKLWKFEGMFCSLETWLTVKPPYCIQLSNGQLRGGSTTGRLFIQALTRERTLGPKMGPQFGGVRFW